MPLSLFPSPVPQPSARQLARARIGGGDFKAVGDEFLGWFITLGGLRSSDDVLEIGCGLGRMAVPLTAFLNEGSYDGFDTARASIKWCQRNISGRYPNFRFREVPVRNSLYNPRGRIDARDVVFPYEARFDFAFLTSVFTHLLPPAALRYLAETQRVLRPGGVLFATFYSYCGLIPPGASESFPHERAQHRLHRLDIPDALVAYPHEWLFDALDRTGFKDLRLLPGRWLGNPTAGAYQDILVATKK